MPRGARLDTPGTLHHVIVRGIERRNIVDDDLDRENFITRLGQVADETCTAIYSKTATNPSSAKKTPISANSCAISI